MMETTIMIRCEQPDEHEILTEISFASKRHSNDPDAYFDVWKHELTITRVYIESNAVFAAETPGGVTGYFSIVHVPEDFWAVPCSCGAATGWSTSACGRNFCGAASVAA